MKSIPRLTIAQPCSAKWELMQGDNNRRFCTECQLHVHNLDQMTHEDKIAFLSSPNQKCGIVSKEVLSRPPRFSRLRVIAATLAVGFPVLFSACSTTRETQSTCPPKTSDHKQVKEDQDGKMLMGEVIIERPLWKRILWPFN